MERYSDRYAAGAALGKLLQQHRFRDVIVLGLPRGGVPVANEVAKALDAPLDIFIVRKLGVPGHEELAMGAIATGEVQVLNEEVIAAIGITPKAIEEVARSERAELRRREREYRGDRPVPDVRGKTAILVDDGLATGSSMRAAAIALKKQHPEKIVVAVPVSARSTCEEFESEVDEVVCAITPEPFYAVGMWYEDFSQTTDEEVQSLLEEAFARKV